MNKLKTQSSVRKFTVSAMHVWNACMERVLRNLTFGSNAREKYLVSEGWGRLTLSIGCFPRGSSRLQENGYVAIRKLLFELYLTCISLLL